MGLRVLATGWLGGDGWRRVASSRQRARVGEPAMRCGKRCLHDVIAGRWPGQGLSRSKRTKNASAPSNRALCGWVGTTELKVPPAALPRLCVYAKSPTRSLSRLGVSPADRKLRHSSYSGSRLQSHTISLRCSELSVAHSSTCAARHASSAVTGGGALPRSASRMPA